MKIANMSGFARDRYKVLRDIWSHPLNRGSRLRAIADYVLWNVVRYTMDARHVLRLPGDLEIILGRRENYATGVYIHSLADFEEMMFCAHLLRPDDIFIDVGANVGMYSVWVAGIAGARCISIEPVPSTFRALQQNVCLNRLGSLIGMHQVACGDAAGGEVTMTTDGGGMNRILVDGEQIGAMVPITTIDTVLAGRRPLVMKMDVEGFELRALQGAAEMLTDRGLKAIIIELQDLTLKKYGTCEQEVRTLLSDYGFGPFLYDPFSRTLSPAANRSRSLNEIFVRSEQVVSARLQQARRISLPRYEVGV